MSEPDLKAQLVAQLIATGGLSHDDATQVADIALHACNQAVDAMMRTTDAAPRRFGYLALQIAPQLLAHTLQRASDDIQQAFSGREDLTASTIELEMEP